VQMGNCRRGCRVECCLFVYNSFFITVEVLSKQKCGSWEAMKLQLMDEKARRLVAVQANNRASSTVARVLSSHIHLTR
jgi:hypothetical protein